jgi:hypothetical protein
MTLRKEEITHIKAVSFMSCPIYICISLSVPPLIQYILFIRQKALIIRLYMIIGKTIQEKRDTTKNDIIMMMII